MTPGALRFTAPLALALVACESDPELLPPRGQVVLHVSTDAPLPPPPGATEAAAHDPMPVAPLFDRLRVEVFAPNETSPCRDCTREFALDRELVRSGQASFGFAPAPQQRGYRARLTLYRGVAVEEERPIVQAAITRVVAMPAVAEEGIVDVGVVLRVDDVGSPKGDLSAPVEAEPGKPDFALVGTWAGAQRRPCVGAARPGEVCVPGGAFWMGDPTVGAASPTFDVSIPRLVVLSPFFVDQGEVTNAAFREARLARVDPDTGLSLDPVEGQNQGSAARFAADTIEGTTLDFAMCNYTSTPRLKPQRDYHRTDRCGDVADANLVVVQPLPADTYETSLRNVDTDALPVNCVSWAKAAEYCRAGGRDLITEAQFEYLAGGLASRHFPWGNEPPACADAVFGRRQESVAACRPPGTLGGPLPPGSGARDRVDLAGGAVVDLAGNLSEWTRDTWHRTTESCWTTPLTHDPVCGASSAVDPPDAVCAPKTGSSFGATPVQSASYTIKGGSWEYADGEGMRASTRAYWWAYGRFSAVGFRCARADG